jgi:ribosomal protein S18 acetylase RimI-like enzyme
VVIRGASPEDYAAVGRLLHDFNTEFGDVTPGPERIAERVSKLIAEGDTAVLLANPGPRGLALLRFRSALWSDGLECYLAELYVQPAARGQGIGRALMNAAMDEARSRGATGMDLNTSVDDKAARALYESLGFRNREGKPDGPVMLFYEREL